MVRTLKKIVRELTPPMAMRMWRRYHPLPDPFVAWQRQINEWTDAKWLHDLREQNPDRRGALTEEERNEITSFWRRYFPDCPIFTDFYERGKMVYGNVDVRRIPFYIWYAYVLPGLNGYMESAVAEDKGTYRFVLPPNVLPLEVVRNINGCYYNADNEIISRDEAVHQLISYSKSFIVKASLNSLGGYSVRLCKEHSREAIEGMIGTYKQDFVCQEVLEQHPFFASFNPTSVNTIRVNSLFLNGKCTVQQMIFRVGGKGSVVDNLCSGGFGVEIRTDGTVDSLAFRTNGEILPFDNERFGGDVSPFVEKIRSFIPQIHNRFSTIPYISWDIAFRKDGAPCCIELNAPSACCEAAALYCRDSVLGDRFDEVMNYVLHHGPRKFNGPPMKMRYDSYKPDWYSN